MDRVDIVIKALKVEKEDAIKIVEHLEVCDCLWWIDEYDEEGKDEPLTDVHCEETFEDMIDWQYEGYTPSEMLGKPTDIKDYPEMLQLSNKIIFWYGLV